MKTIKILSHLITSSLFFLLFAIFVFFLYAIATQIGQLLIQDIAPKI